MDDDVTLTGDETVVASQIKTIDRDLEALGRRTQESVICGLHGSGAALMTNIVQTSADKRKEALLAERADLVKALQAEIARN